MSSENNQLEAIYLGDKFRSIELDKQNDPTKSLYLYLDLFEEAKKIGESDTFIGEVLYKVAGTYEELNILDSSHEYYLIGLEYANRTENLLLRARLLNGLAIASNKRGEFTESLKYQFESLTLKEEAGDKREIIKSYNNLGVIYKHLKDFDNTEKYTKRALELAKEIKDDLLIVASLNNLGLLYQYSEDYDNAKSSYLEALTYCRTLNNSRMYASTYNNLSLVSYRVEDFEQSIYYSSESLKYYIELSDKRGEARVLFSKAVSLIRLKKYDEGLYLCDQALKLTEDLDYILLRHSILSELSDFYGEQEDYKKAYFFQKEAGKLKNDICNREKFDKIKNIEASFKLIKEVKEKEIYRLRNIELAQANRKLEEMVQSRDKLYSIISHDLRSPVTSIIGYCDFMLNDMETLPNKEKVEFTSIILQSAQEISMLLSNLLDWTRSQMGSLKQDPRENSIKESIERSISYLDICAKRKNIEIVIKCEEDLPKLHFDSKSIETTIRNLLSNSIKFSFKDSSVIIGVVDKVDALEIYIEDFGIGMSQEQIDEIIVGNLSNSNEGTDSEEGTGLGLMLSKEFVELHRGELSFVSKDKGIIVKFTLPK